MLYKGIVSTINSTNNKVRVLIPQINYITPELQVAKYVADVKPNDTVMVAFVGDSMIDGIIIENISSGIISNNPDTTFVHEQIASSAEWIITHNLNKYPSVTLVDSAGSVVGGDIEYVSQNEINIKFSSAFSGRAFLN